MKMATMPPNNSSAATNTMGIMGSRETSCPNITLPTIAPIRPNTAWRPIAVDLDKIQKALNYQKISLLLLHGFILEEILGILIFIQFEMSKLRLNLNFQ